jgi:hypothetical protein
MAKSEAELMISVQPGLYPAGTRLLADDPEVLEHPRIWVPFSAGDRAIFSRRDELKQEHDAQTERHRAAARAAAISIGTRILPSDDAISEASKRAVIESPGDLELAYDDTGHVIGARARA